MAKTNRHARGAYFLASDGVLDLAVAFLGSFRRSNPDLPLYLIPFDDRLSQLEKLKKRYRFEVFSDDKILASCDRIGQTIHGQPTAEHRKLAIWEGVFEEFVYFDVDTVVLEDTSFVWPWLSHYDFIASQSNIPENTKYVWKESIRGVKALSAKQISYSAATGFVASRKGSLTLKGALAKLPEAALLSPHMALDYKEQPFLNYLVVTSDLRFSSLAKIAAQNPDLDIPIERWAGVPLKEVTQGRFPSTTRPRVLFVHWAGLWKQGLHRTSQLWRHYSDAELV